MGWGTLSQNQIIVTLRLLGQGPYAAGLRQAATNTMSLARATAATGLAMNTSSKRTWMMNQALYTMRRYAFYGTLAISALALGIIKLGYSYLATRDSARAALRPIFKDQQALNKELDYLFKLSKYSPFVLKDMTDALRVMYPALHGAGMGVGEMNSLILSMTNILSQSGKTSPAALNRISYAIQHMLYQGRLTGILVRQLAASGVDVVALLSNLGYAHANLSSIARLNIPPRNVINALIDLGQSGIFKGAAQRIAMQSFPGMLQVLRDSVSKFMGLFLGGTYNSARSKLLELIKPGGIFDRLGNAKSGHQAVMMLSTAITGNTGLGRGFELLISTLKNLGLVFANIVIPAFIMGAHALIIFAPLLFALNFSLGLLAKHSWLVKYALVPLAAWFIITHTAMMSLWVASKLLTIATFGLVTALDFEAAALKLLYVWDFLVTTSTWILTAALGAQRTAAILAWSATLAPIALVLIGLAAVAGAIYLIIKYWTELKRVVGGGGLRDMLGINGAGGGGKFTGGGVVGNWLSSNAGVPTWLTGAHKIRAFAGGGYPDGWSLIGEHGPELLNLPRGSSVTPLSRNSITPVGDLSTVTGGNDRPIIVELKVGREVLARQLVREREDREARR